MVIPFSYRWLPCTTQTSTPPYLGCAFPHHWRTGLACRHKTVAKFWPDEVALLYLTTLQQFVLFPQCLIKAILWVLNLLHYISLCLKTESMDVWGLWKRCCVLKKNPFSHSDTQRDHHWFSYRKQLSFFPGSVGSFGIFRALMNAQPG